MIVFICLVLVVLFLITLIEFAKGMGHCHHVCIFTQNNDNYKHFYQADYYHTDVNGAYANSFYEKLLREENIDRSLVIHAFVRVNDKTITIVDKRKK